MHNCGAKGRIAVTSEAKAQARYLKKEEEKRKRKRKRKKKKGYAPERVTLLSLNSLGWLMGLEPTTTGITILDSTN